MPPISAYCQTLDPFRAIYDPVGPFISRFRMQEWIAAKALLNLRLSLCRVWIHYQREALRPRRIELEHRRRVERFSITTTQGHSTDILRINRLPAYRYFRLLRIICTMRC